MASQLPVLSGTEVVRAFERLGWRIARRRGSHVIMIKLGQRATLSVPDHPEIARGTLRGLLRASGHSIDEFVQVLA